MNHKTILAVAALLFAVAPAYAATPVPVDVLPSAMTTFYKVDGANDESKHDLWCYIDKIKAYRREDCRDEDGWNDGWMSVDGLQQSEHERACSVKQIWQLVKGRTYRIDLRCSGLGEFWDERAVLSLSADKKTLYFKSEWRSKTRDEKSED